MELLPRFELGTSSLPTALEDEILWFCAVSGAFCSVKVRIFILLIPSVPPQFFRWWVCVWVRGSVRRVFLCRNSLSVNYEQIIVYDFTTVQQISYDGQISRRSVPYRVMAIFLVVQLNTVIIKEYTCGVPKGYAVLFYILSVFSSSQKLPCLIQRKQKSSPARKTC